MGAKYQIRIIRNFHNKMPGLSICASVHNISYNDIGASSGEAKEVEAYGKQRQSYQNPGSRRHVSGVDSHTGAGHILGSVD